MHFCFCLLFHFLVDHIKQYGLSYGFMYASVWLYIVAKWIELVFGMKFNTFGTAALYLMELWMHLRKVTPSQGKWKIYDLCP